METSIIGMFHWQILFQGKPALSAHKHLIKYIYKLQFMGKNWCKIIFYEKLIDKLKRFLQSEIYVSNYLKTGQH